MTAITISEFNSLPNALGESVWPASGANVSTTVTAPVTHVTAPNTKHVIVTSDADCRMAIGAATAGVSMIPILSAIPQGFTFEGGVVSLKFS